jgi:hypothetical protein
VKCEITIIDSKGLERTVDGYLCPKCSIRSAKPMGIKSMDAVKKLIITPKNEPSAINPAHFQIEDWD